MDTDDLEPVIKTKGIDFDTYNINFLIIEKSFIGYVFQIPA